MQKSGSLSEVLIHYRGIARMSQRQIADSTKALGDDQRVSEATIRAIETDQTISKPPTLRKLARGLARDSFTGEVNEQRSEAVYQDLIVAAGYQSRREEPAAVIEAAAIVDFRTQLEEFYGAENVEFIDAVGHAIKGFPPKEAGFVRTFLLGGLRALHNPRENRRDGGSPIAGLAHAR